jgi:polyhydroxyalkanoate synthesis regulator phasin
MSDPADLVPRLLRELRVDVDRRFADVEKRFETLEKQMKSQRDMVQSESILARYAVIEVDGRLDALEDAVKALEARR